MEVAIVGATGAVGKELKRLIEERKFPVSKLHLYDSKSVPSFDSVDLAFFCVGSEVAKKLVVEAQKKETICIDASTAFREHADVPLVIPEINGHLLKSHGGIIASPNCTTSIMLMALAPLHEKFQIRRIVAATYQAVSGAGAKAMLELKGQTRDVLEKQPIEPTVFPSQCAFNVFPHEAAQSEESKMLSETRKILGSDKIQVSATCIRVPVFRVHSEVLNVEFEKPISEEEAFALLKNAKGIQFKENVCAVDAAHQNDVFFGTLRQDLTQKNTLEMWVVGDQLLKGAALNMIQIAEQL